MAKEGSKKVPIAGVDDKRPITTVFWYYNGWYFPSSTVDLSG